VEIAERLLRRLPDTDRLMRAAASELLARALIARGELQRAVAVPGELEAIAGAADLAPLRAAAS
jgi:hypothetical protein